MESRIGRGGMASVFRVRHPELGTRFALKLLDLRTPVLRERLLAEGRMQATLQHPNVVSVIDVVVHDGCPGLVMEYVDGPSLKDLMDAGPIPAAARDELFTGIVHGVRAAHKLGFVHRDLKPANILLARTDDRLIPKVADFGLAKAATEEGDARRTRSGMMFGTPMYMAPEQARSARDVDHRADIFALGVMLYELVTGQLPVDTEDFFDLFSRVMAQDYPSPRELVPDLPEHQEETLLAAMHPDRDRRIPDCDTLLAAWRGKVRLDPDAAPVVETTSAFDREFLAKVATLGGSSERSGPASPVDVAPAVEERPSSAGLGRIVAVVGGMGVAGMLAASVMGLLALAGGALLVWSGGGDGGERPEIEVRGVEPPVVPTPAPPPVAVPVAPEPEPVPAPVAPEPPPTPTPAPTSPTAPGPAPRNARLTVTGDPVRDVRLVRTTDGATFRPDSVPPGVYTIRWTWPDSREGSLEGVAITGRSVRMDCVAKFWSCAIR
ncbi:MAG: serine/threonine protein kinase [Alphaproteobacteria bacterium]|nr:serine/threonine protein kinase [Alphaproteobacteria bacterium]MCB9697658.1 serine/threonine protein kinase [Alphaproteobacteria bacterium]